jgi:hypothetical protein
MTQIVPGTRSAASAASLATTALFLAACGDAPDYTAAREYWVQPDSVIIGLGQPGDVKALTRDNAWVADLMSGTIFSLTPPEGRYVGIGMADREPAEVETPAKIAVSAEFGLAAFDAETGQVDLFTLEGEHIRGFEPGFIPAVMSFSRQPVGLTFGIAEGDSASGRHPVVIRTGLRGEGRDTLLSPAHGPEVLRTAAAEPGETSMSPSASGMWVWSRAAPDTVFDLSPGGVRRLLLRAEDTSAVGVLADRELEIVWLVHPEETGGARSYAAYDARLAAPAGEPPPEGSVAFLGVRTTPENFRPWVVHDGVIVGVRRIAGGGLALSAYELNSDRFGRGGGGRKRAVRGRSRGC